MSQRPVLWKDWFSDSLVGPPSIAQLPTSVEFEVSEFQLARWISSEDRKTLDAFIASNTSSIADDVDGDPVYLAKNEFYLGYTKERAEGINFANVKDVKKRA